MQRRAQLLGDEECEEAGEPAVASEQPAASSDEVQAAMRSHVADDKFETGAGVYTKRDRKTLPPKVKILFLGMNAKQESQMRLGREFLKIFCGMENRAEIVERQVESADVGREIFKAEADIVHFSCHGEKSEGSSERIDSRGGVSDDDLVQVILENNKCLMDKKIKPDGVRLMILNSCHSEELARKLHRGTTCEGTRLLGIDFVIGHEGEVKEDDALKFSEVFYEEFIGQRKHLQVSFNTSKLSSRHDEPEFGYKLISEFDAYKFQLSDEDEQSSSQGAAENSGSPLQRNLEDIFGTETAKQICQDIGLQKVEDLIFVKENNVTEMKGLKQPQKRKLLQLIQDATQKNLVKEEQSLSFAEKIVDDSEASGYDTDPVSDTEEEKRSQPLLLACYSPSVRPCDFRQSMSKLLKDFVVEARKEDGSRTSFSLLLLKRSRRIQCASSRQASDFKDGNDILASFSDGESIKSSLDRIVRNMLPAPNRDDWDHAFGRRDASKQDVVDRADKVLARYLFSSSGGFQTLGDPAPGKEQRGSLGFLLASRLTTKLLFAYLNERKRLHQASPSSEPLQMMGFDAFVASNGIVFALNQDEISDGKSIKESLEATAALASDVLASLVRPCPPAIFSEETEHILEYLKQSENFTKQIPDSVPGRNLKVREQCVKLRLIEGTAVQDFADFQENQKWFCPMSKKLMNDPVVCSDGHTYERAEIERMLKLPYPSSPVTGSPLESNEVEANENMKREIDDFKKKKLEEEEARKTAAEGREERNMELRRRGYCSAQFGDAGQGYKTDEEVLGLVREGKMPAVCITGPPACGKTISMLRIATQAAQTALKKMQPVPDDMSAPDDIGIPLFVRVSELMMYLRSNSFPGCDLVELFVRKRWPEFEDVLVKLYHLERLLLIVDGLDEGAGRQKLVEDFLGELLQRQPGAGIVISTREKHFDESRRAKRLEAFKPAQVQPLDRRGQVFPSTSQTPAPCQR